jgi:NADH:ubiquinone reductase (H+-translocating)
VSKVLEDKGVEIHLGTGVKEVHSGHAVLSDGSLVPTRCVIWGGGIQAAAVAADGGLAQGRGGRVDVQPDLTLSGVGGVYAIGDVANIPGSDHEPLPQLGSVAMQSGQWAADNILADFKDGRRKDFAYHDKGIMAMIGRGAAIAEVGKHHHEIHGEMAHMAWLGVHASLMTGAKSKIEAFVEWAWSGFSKTSGPHVLDRGDAAEINWDDDDAVTGAAAAPASGATGSGPAA